jgi:hypothetical protein
MLAANPFAKPWIAGTTPERPVEFAAVAAAAGEAEARGSGAAVAFAAASKTIATDMSSHLERQ